MSGRMSAMRIIALLGWAVAVLFLAGSARAEISASTIRDVARIEQQPNARVPGDLAFVDERGRPVTLAEMFADRPALLVLDYSKCPDLCPMTLRHLAQGLNGIGPIAGTSFNVAVVSIDPRDTPATAAAQRVQFVRGYKGGDAAGGWHFLTGTQDAIDRLKSAVGYHCAFDAAHDRYAHAAGVMVIAPGGRVSHYFFGVDYAPADLEAALRDAAAGHVTRVDQPEQQYCFAYDAAAGGRGRWVIRSLRAAAVAWIVGVAAYVGISLTRERRASREVMRP